MNTRSAATSMKRPLEQQAPPKTPATQQRTSNELVRLIRKLRWIGMDNEADALAEELARRRVTDTVSVITAFRETD